MGLFARAFKKENPEEHFKENTLRQQAELHEIKQEVRTTSEDIRELGYLLEDLTRIFAGIQIEEKEINKLYFDVMNLGHKMNKEQAKTASINLKELKDEMNLRERKLKGLLKKEINDQAGMRAKIIRIKSTVRKMDTHIKRNDRFVNQVLKYITSLKGKLNAVQMNMPNFDKRRGKPGRGRSAIDRMRARNEKLQRDAGRSPYNVRI